MRVQKNFQHVKSLEDLGDTTLLLIGFWEMGCTDWDIIAKCMGMQDQRPIRQLAKVLQTSKNPTIRRYVDGGLPPGTFRPFYYSDVTIRCPLCGKRVRCAPCPRCSMVAMGEPNRPSTEQGETLPPAPRRATKTMPGTPEKIAVMCVRFERGERVFHPKDRTLYAQGGASHERQR